MVVGRGRESMAGRQGGGGGRQLSMACLECQWHGRDVEIHFRLHYIKGESFVIEHASYNWTFRRSCSEGTPLFVGIRK